MDDLVLFGDSRGELAQQAAALVAWLAEHRRLAVRSKGEAVMSTRGSFTFLGYTVDRVRRRVAGATLRRMRARLRAAARDEAESEGMEGELAATLKGLLF